MIWCKFKYVRQRLIDYFMMNYAVRAIPEQCFSFSRRFCFLFFRLIIFFLLTRGRGGAVAAQRTKNALRKWSKHSSSSSTVKTKTSIMRKIKLKKNLFYFWCFTRRPPFIIIIVIIIVIVIIINYLLLLLLLLIN